MRVPKDYDKRFKEKCVLHAHKKPIEANAIAVGGMISAGKSTIVERIVKDFGFEPVYELSNDPNDLMNILLERMYQREQIAESVCQLQFLLNRFKRYKDCIMNSKNPATKVFDRTIFEDRLFAFHNMLDQPDVYEYYEKLWRSQVQQLLYEVGTPKLYIILKLDWEHFLERLYKRNRAIEIKNFKKNEEYFKLLNKGYIEYLTSVCATYAIPYTVIDVAGLTVDQEMKIIKEELVKNGILPHKKKSK